MATADIRERLQPALLDRLIDNARDHRSEADDQRTMSKAAMRTAILRDLGWLLNAVRPLGQRAHQEHRMLNTSVLGYGLPPMSGQLASKVDIALLEREIHDAILRFEPRILAHDLTVRALESSGVLDTHNVIEFEIKGSLWAQPVPLELLLRTQVDLEDGQVRVSDLAPITSVATLRNLRPQG
jgi:type VI secretion system protein ImpF